MTTEPKITGEKKYTGSCHCGVVRFEATTDLGEGAMKCNCTICKKKNYLGKRVKVADFKIVTGKDDLVEYQFNSKSVKHMFCKHCGIHTMGWSNIPQAGGESYSVNVHCLDDVDLEGLKVKYVDGLHNNWWNPTPAFP